MNKQYIGARYVPLIFKNENGNSEWIKELPYEFLTIVTYLGNSYTSIKNVPPNTDILNTDYWILTGNYNAQVDSYRKEVSEEVENRKTAVNDAIKKCNDYTDLKTKRKFILLGDSFGAGIIRSGESTIGWIKYTENLYKDLYDFYDGLNLVLEGNSGFNSTLKFKTMLENINIEDKDSITDIIVFGGTNDLSHVSGLGDSIDEFFNYVKTNFKNALVSIGVLGTDLTNLYNNIYPYYNQHCVKNGGHFIKDTLLLMCDNTLISDGTHLTESGYNLYNPYIADSVINGGTSFKFILKRKISGVGTNVTLTDYDSFEYEITNNSITTKYISKNSEYGNNASSLKFNKYGIKIDDFIKIENMIKFIQPFTGQMIPILKVSDNTINGYILFYLNGNGLGAIVNQFENVESFVMLLYNENFSL